MDSVVHFEIPADDPKRASKFYNDAFGWHIQQWESMPYWMVSTAESDEMGVPKKPGAINGGLAAREGPLKSIVVTVMVDDVDKALEKIERVGGKTVQKKQAIGDMGFTAYFTDSEGNVVGLFQTAGPM
jgi:uncharacterized protein